MGTSPLFEADTIFKTPDEIEHEFNIDELYTESQEIINTIMSSEDINKRVGVAVFVEANKPGLSINKISGKTGISRTYLTKKYEEGRELILKHLSI